MVDSEFVWKGKIKDKRDRALVNSVCTMCYFIEVCEINGFGRAVNNLKSKSYNERMMDGIDILFSECYKIEPEDARKKLKPIVMEMLESKVKGKYKYFKESYGLSAEYSIDIDHNLSALFGFKDNVYGPIDFIDIAYSHLIAGAAGLKFKKMLAQFESLGVIPVSASDNTKNGGYAVQNYMKYALFMFYLNSFCVLGTDGKKIRYQFNEIAIENYCGIPSLTKRKDDSNAFVIGDADYLSPKTLGDPIFSTNFGFEIYDCGKYLILIYNGDDPRNNDLALGFMRYSLDIKKKRGDEFVVILGNNVSDQFKQTICNTFVDHNIHTGCYCFDDFEKLRCYDTWDPVDIEQRMISINLIKKYEEGMKTMGKTSPILQTVLDIAEKSW